MEINKQLFEDVLSGKLKGMFVLRNKRCVETKFLTKSNFKSSGFLYKLHDLDVVSTDYTEHGKACNCAGSNFDIVEFISDTNMKENELTIEIPKGKIVDWDESKKQNKIVLKDKQLTYEEICNKLPVMIDIPLFDTSSKDGNALVANEHQLECILAKNKLANVAVYLNDGWKPINGESVWIIEYNCYLGYHARSIQAGSTAFNCYELVIFKSKELALQAIEILGEETIKLALEPLGI